MLAQYFFPGYSPLGRFLPIRRHPCQGLTTTSHTADLQTTINNTDADDEAMLTCVRDVCGPHDPSDLLHALEVGAETAVAAENLLIHNGGDGQAVEAVRERLPQLDVVTSLAYVMLMLLHNYLIQLSLTFIIESIDPVDGSTLMVSSE